MKLNKKGFTLIELLAVVVILLAISVIAISSISAAIERNKAKQLATRTELIVTNVNVYYQSHKNSFSATFPNSCIWISELVTNNIISSDEALDPDGEMIVGAVIDTNNDGNFEYRKDGC